MLFAIEDKTSLMNLLPEVYAVPSNKENLFMLEGALTKNLDQAVRFVCIAGLAEQLLKHENSARAKVSLIYMVSRTISEDDVKPGKKESRQLWSNVWSFASQIPMVAAEMEEQAKIGNLRNWQSDVQTYARRRWRTLKDEQMPRVKDQIKDLEYSVLGFLNIKQGAVSLK